MQAGNATPVICWNLGTFVTCIDTHPQREEYGGIPMPRYELSKETREFFQNQGRFKAAHLQKSIHCCMHLCHLLTWAISHFNPFHPFISITHEATHSLRILQKECYLRWSCARQENNEALLDLVFSPRDPQVLRLVWASTQSTVETCKVSLGRQGWTHWATNTE